MPKKKPAKNIKYSIAIFLNYYFADDTVKACGEITRANVELRGTDAGCDCVDIWLIPSSSLSSLYRIRPHVQGRKTVLLEGFPYSAPEVAEQRDRLFEDGLDRRTIGFSPLKNIAQNSFRKALGELEGFLFFVDVCTGIRLCR